MLRGTDDLRVIRHNGGRGITVAELNAMELRRIKLRQVVCDRGPVNLESSDRRPATETALGGQPESITYVRQLAFNF